jgi:hypothetical protein
LHCLRVVAGLVGSFAGEHQRAGRLRRGFAGLAHGVVGVGRLLLRVGFECELAPVVRDARRIRAGGAAALELLCIVDGGAPVA